MKIVSKSIVLMIKMENLDSYKNSAIILIMLSVQCKYHSCDNCVLFDFGLVLFLTLTPFLIIYYFVTFYDKKFEFTLKMFILTPLTTALLLLSIVYGNTRSLPAIVRVTFCRYRLNLMKGQKKSCKSVTYSVTLIHNYQHRFCNILYL